MGDEGRPLLLDVSSNQMQPLPWDPRRAKISGVFILLSVALERLAYYAVVINLFLYLNRGQTEKEEWEPIEALTAVYIVHGVSCISAPVGGWVSDSLIGRFWAINVGMLIYICGYSLLTALSINELKPLGCNWQLDANSLNSSTFHWHIIGISTYSGKCSAHIYTILILIGVGVGFLRANIPPFGAEQVRAGGDHSVREFFNTYYWCINFGCLLGIGGLAYVEQNIKDGFFISFLVATIALCLSLVCFCAGRRYYLIHRPGSLIVFNIFRIVWEGMYNSCKRHDSVQGSPMFRRHQPQPVTPIALTPSWIDRAKVSLGGSFHDATVEDVKHVARNLIFISVLIPYWLVFAQVTTSFQAQGLHMNLHLNQSVDPNFEIPSAWLTLCDQVFILVLLPFVNLVIYPLMDRKNICTSPLYRIIVGMLISLIAVLMAAIVEHFRLEEWRKGNIVVQEISGTAYNASGLSVLYQIPQYCLIGTAEVFAGVAGLEYAYTTSPRTFQGIIMGLYASIEGLGSFLSVLLVIVTRALHLGWIRSEANFNQGHIDYFFYLLAIIQSCAIIILGLVIYLRWEPLPPEPQGEPTLGSSALHTDFHRSTESASQLPSPQ